MSVSLAAAITQQIIEKLPQGVVVVDANERITWANRSLLTLLGAEDKTLDQLNDEQSEQLTEWLTRQVAETSDGQKLNKSCIELQGGGFAFLFEPCADQGADNDPLTGVAGNHAFTIALQTLLSVARRYEKPLSAAIIRIDNLAQIPHDEALIATCQQLKEALRWSDMLGRLNDDSFVIILPETDQDACGALLEKLQRHLQRITLEEGDTPHYRMAALESDKRDDVERLLTRLQHEVGKAIEDAQQAS